LGFGRTVRILLGTGIRRGEFVHAQTTDIQGGKLVIPESKSRKVRRVPLPPDVLSDCMGRVGRLTPLQDACAFNKRVRELSGIERFHSHLCRHTFATEWREAGGSLAALQAVLGHGTIAVTGRYGTIGDDLVEPEALRLRPAPCAGRCSVKGTKNGTEFPMLAIMLVRREGIEPEPSDIRASNRRQHEAIVAQ
jgi:integrase